MTWHAPSPPTVLDTALALSRLAGDHLLYGRLCAEFPGRAAELVASLAGGGGNAARYAHGLKSAAASIGALGLQRSAAQLETLLLHGAEGEAVAGAVAEIKLELALVVVDLGRWTSPEPAVSESPPPGEVADALATLRRLITEDNVDAAGVAECLVRMLECDPRRAAMARVCSLLRNYDFVGAQQVLDGSDMAALAPLD